MFTCFWSSLGVVSGSGKVSAIATRPSRNVFRSSLVQDLKSVTFAVSFFQKLRSENSSPSPSFLIFRLVIIQYIRILRAYDSSGDDWGKWRHHTAPQRVVKRPRSWIGMRAVAWSGRLIVRLGTSKPKFLKCHSHQFHSQLAYIGSIPHRRASNEHIRRPAQTRARSPRHYAGRDFR